MKHERKLSHLGELARLLREANEEESSQEKNFEKEPGEDSIDDQIDKFLSEYESEAKNSKNEAKDFRALTRRFLSEAEEDKKESEKNKEKKPSKPASEDIDMGSYVSSVMRLVENYDSLLEVKNTILRRAANYIAKNYEKDAVDAFKEELLEGHGIEIGKSKFEQEDEFQAPKAASAGPAGGGA